VEHVSVQGCKTYILFENQNETYAIESHVCLALISQISGILYSRE